MELNLGTGGNFGVAWASNWRFWNGADFGVAFGVAAHHVCRLFLIVPMASLALFDC